MVSLIFQKGVACTVFDWQGTISPSDPSNLDTFLGKLFPEQWACPIQREEQRF